jgi:hypothetical protein
MGVSEMKWDDAWEGTQVGSKVQDNIGHHVMDAALVLL